MQLQMEVPMTMITNVYGTNERYAVIIGECDQVDQWGYPCLLGITISPTTGIPIGVEYSINTNIIRESEKKLDIDLVWLGVSLWWKDTQKQQQTNIQKSISLWLMNTIHANSMHEAQCIIENALNLMNNIPLTTVHKFLQTLKSLNIRKINKIKHAWLNAWYNPVYDLCQKRLNREFSSFSKDLISCI